jgi:hypothetical protein
LDEAQGLFEPGSLAGECGELFYGGCHEGHF